MPLSGRRPRLLVAVALVALALVPHLSTGNAANGTGAPATSGGHIMALDLGSVGLIPAMVPRGAEVEMVLREPVRRLAGLLLLAGLLVALTAATTGRRWAVVSPRSTRRGVWAAVALARLRAPPAIRV